MGAGVIEKRQPGRRGRRRGRAKAMSEINVTPFVDVMLVLLIIFMVAAPLLTVGVEMDLPKTSAASLPTEQEEPLTINIDADNRIYIQTTETDRATLIPKLQAKIVRLNKERGYTFCVIEHDMDFIARLCDPVICMAEGHVLAEGTIHEIKSNEQVIEAYLGTGLKNKATA